jgi:membrane protein YqaA with SNARE-associated domain
MGSFIKRKTISKAKGIIFERYGVLKIIVCVLSVTGNTFSTCDGFNENAFYTFTGLYD